MAAISEKSKRISEFFWGVDFAGALATNFELAFRAFFPFFGLVLVVFLSTLSSSRIVGYLFDRIVVVRLIKVPFCKPP